MASYDRPEPGVWIRPIRHGYKLSCCDCGLVYTLDFKLVKWGKGKKIMFRTFRNARSTALIRRHRKRLKDRV